MPLFSYSCQKQLFFIPLLAFCALQNLYGQQSKADTLVEFQELKSQVFNNTRTLRVLLPPGYYDSENKGKTYPVLYMNDGFAVFKNWGLKKTVYGLISSGQIEPIIIVGIDNAMKNNNDADARTKEYLVFPDRYETSVPQPSGALYPRFLTTEVMPLIENKYSVSKELANTALGGSSLGAYVALYTYLATSETIGKLLLESPPLFLSDSKLLDFASNQRAWPGKISIGLGTRETEDEAIKSKGDSAITRFRHILDKHQASNYQFVLQGGATHSSSAWRSRLAGDLLFLFGKH